MDAKDLKHGDKITCVSGTVKGNNAQLDVSVKLKRYQVTTNTAASGPPHLKGGEHQFFLTGVKSFPSEIQTDRSAGTATFKLYLYDPTQEEERKAWLEVFEAANNNCKLFVNHTPLMAAMAATNSARPHTNISVDVAPMLELSNYEAGTQIIATVSEALKEHGFESMAERYELAATDLIDLYPLLIVTSAYVRLECNGAERKLQDRIDIDEVIMQVAANMPTMTQDEMKELFERAGAIVEPDETTL